MRGDGSALNAGMLREEQEKERDSVNVKTRLFQGDERLSGAELNIIHLQLSLKHKRHRLEMEVTLVPPPAISCLHFLIIAAFQFLPIIPYFKEIEL